LKHKINKEKEKRSQGRLLFCFSVVLLFQGEKLPLWIIMVDSCLQVVYNGSKWGKVGNFSSTGRTLIVTMLVYLLMKSLFYIPVTLHYKTGFTLESYVHRGIFPQS